MTFTTQSPTPDVDLLTTNVAIPGMGQIPINAFVVHGSEPLLVDTGPVVDREEFMTTLRSVIDPRDLRWIWLTHTDYDHVGALPQLLDENPDLRVITTFVGVGIMGLYAPLPMDRVYLLNPGQQLAIGDRTLTAFRPPAFDNPVTTGFHDSKTGALFSSDCFGALLADVPQNAAELSDDELHDGQVFWATVDSPWLQRVAPGAMQRELDVVRQFEPTTVFSSHLPPAPGAMVDRLLASLASVPDAPPFVGPDQAALEGMLAEMTAGAPAG